MPKNIAKKPVKKAPSKSAPVAAPAAVVAVPMCGCGCCRGGFGRFIKKLLVVVIIFALGFMACKFTSCGCMHKKMYKHRGQFQFVDGCLDLSKIKNPKVAMRISAADADGNGCITKDELKAWKAEFKAQKAAMKERKFQK